MNDFRIVPCALFPRKYIRTLATNVGIENKVNTQINSDLRNEGPLVAGFGLRSEWPSSTHAGRWSACL
jgi:hypothetical protein